MKWLKRFKLYVSARNILKGIRHELKNVNTILKAINNHKKELDIEINYNNEKLINSEKEEVKYYKEELELLNLVRKDLIKKELKLLNSALVLVRNFNGLNEFTYTKNTDIIKSLGNRDFSDYYLESNKDNIYEQINSILN